MLHRYINGHRWRGNVLAARQRNGSGRTPLFASVPSFGRKVGYVADTHVQSFTANGREYITSGNLNGIAEPGEIVTVEPQWSTAPSLAPVTISSNIFFSNPEGWGVYAVPSWYSVATGVSDCWSAGSCYVMGFTPGFYRGTTRHADRLIFEDNPGAGAQTPGSPIRVHVGATYADVPTSSSYYGAIESLAGAEIADSCTNPQSFCPDALITRAQLSMWLIKANHPPGWQPPPCNAAPFTDVQCSHPAAVWIAEMKAEGISLGTGNNMYTPEGSVQRQQMAVMLLRARYGASYVPPACRPDFADVTCPGGFGADFISDLKTRGITSGCTPTTFCPTSLLTRSQAATFVTRAFGLAIDAPQCPAGSTIYAAPYEVIP